MELYAPYNSHTRISATHKKNTIILYEHNLCIYKFYPRKAITLLWVVVAKVVMVFMLVMVVVVVVIVVKGTG